MSGSITVTSVLRRTAQVYRAQALLILSASLLIVVAVGGIESLPIGNSYVRLAAALVSLTAVALFAGVVVQIVADSREHRSKASVRQTVRTAGLAAGELALVLIVASIVIALLLVVADFLSIALVVAAVLGVHTFRHHIVPGVGFGLVVILVFLPCVYLLVNWSLVAPVVVLERPGGLRAVLLAHEHPRSAENGLSRWFVDYPCGGAVCCADNDDDAGRWTKILESRNTCIAYQRWFSGTVFSGGSALHSPTKATHRTQWRGQDNRRVADPGGPALSRLIPGRCDSLWARPAGIADDLGVGARRVICRYCNRQKIGRGEVVCP